MNKEKKIVVSGYFNPIHIGHIRLFKKAKKLGKKLIVIVNNDEQVKLKGSFPFMNEDERMEIVKSNRYVNKVVLSIDKNKTVCETLKKIKPDIFVNGGDRKENEIPEIGICEELGIQAIFGVGGKKVQSSSWLLNKIKNVE